MTGDDGIRALRDQLSDVMRRVGILEDIHAIRTLHHKYGYYLDKSLYAEIVDLFADDSRAYFLNGIYKGRAGVRRLYCDWFRNFFTDGRDGPTRGFLDDHLQMQDIVDVAPDGLSARARFRSLMQAGQHDSKDPKIAGFPLQCWEGGIYENEYVKERGVWRISVLNYHMLWQAEYEKGWAHDMPHLSPLSRTFPEDPLGPDELSSETPTFWPETRTVPFHYAHPVTGLMSK